ncbi:MAG TPA: hypothetical protein VJB57_16840, partial [Dehalococcoidia bacterium]|nr:hypothetical protein [Dehalococcoidia bacterium]
LTNSFAPYAASGGHRYRIFSYAVVMFMISGVAMLVVPAAVQALFSSVGSTPTAGVPVTPGR